MHPRDFDRLMLAFIVAFYAFVLWLATSGAVYVPRGRPAVVVTPAPPPPAAPASPAAVCPVNATCA